MVVVEDGGWREDGGGGRMVVEDGGWRERREWTKLISCSKEEEHSRGKEGGRGGQGGRALGR